MFYSQAFGETSYGTKCLFKEVEHPNYQLTSVMYRYSFPNNWFPGSISEKNQWHEMKATLVGNRFYDGKLNHQADGLHCNVNVGGGGSACLFWLPLVCKIEEFIAVERCSLVTDFLLFFLLWTTLAHWMHSCDGLVTSVGVDYGTNQRKFPC